MGRLQPGHEQTNALAAISSERVTWLASKALIKRAGGKFVYLGRSRELTFQGPTAEVNDSFERSNDRMNTFLENYHDLIKGHTFTELTSGLLIPDEQPTQEIPVQSYRGPEFTG